MNRLCACAIGSIVAGNAAGGKADRHRHDNLPRQSHPNVGQRIGRHRRGERRQHYRLVSACDRKGFPEVKISIAQEVASGQSLLLEDVVATDASAIIARKIGSSHTLAIDDTIKVLDPAALDRAIGLIAAASRLEFFGAGTAAPIAEDAVCCFLRLGIPTKCMTDSHT